MQLSEFSKYISEVVSEGDRLQKIDNVGNPTTTGRYTHGQTISAVIAILSVLLLRYGFSDNFAGFVSSFLAIFVGLFTTVVISMEEKSKTLYANWEMLNELQRPKVETTRNYMVRFTGLTSYSILLALVVIVLLLFSLSGGVFAIDLWHYPFIHSFKEFNAISVERFFINVLIIAHRFFTVYFLSNVFAITIFSTTSYFSRILFEYNELRPPDAKP